MNFQTFVAKLQTFARFPEPLKQYAENVAEKLTDADRAGLMTKLEKQYKEFVVLDDKRIKRQEDMIEELVAFKKKHFPALQKAAEAAEREDAEKGFDEKLNSATKKNK